MWNITGQGQNLSQGASWAAVSMLQPPIFPEQASGGQNQAPNAYSTNLHNTLILALLPPLSFSLFPHSASWNPQINNLCSTPCFRLCSQGNSINAVVIQVSSRPLFPHLQSEKMELNPFQLPHSKMPPFIHHKKGDLFNQEKQTAPFSEAQFIIPTGSGIIRLGH